MRSPYRRLRDRFLTEHLVDTRDRRCLDVGGARRSGPMGPSHWDWTIVDPLGGTDAAGRDILKGWADQLPFEDESFDLVKCTDVLNLYAEPWRPLAEMARVLMPHGRLIVTVAFMAGTVENGDLSRLTREGWEYEFARVGALDMPTIEPLGGMGSVWLNTTFHMGLSWLAGPLAACCQRFDLVGNPRWPVGWGITAWR